MQLPQFPKYTSAALTRVFEKHLEVYADLGRHYMNGTWGKVTEIASQRVFKDVSCHKSGQFSALQLDCLSQCREY